MKKWIITCCMVSMVLLNMSAQGLPFFKNISPTEYKAHKQNFDVDIDRDGIIFIANFEGLLYYDNSQWRMIYTPGITRVTVVFKDSKAAM